MAAGVSVLNRVKLEEAAIQEMLRDPAGDVAMMISEMVAHVAGAARAMVAKRTGQTLASIRSEMQYASNDPWDEVHGYPWGEVYASYATFFLEKGVKPHLIFAHGNYSLAWEKLEYFGPVVQHPGMHPEPFLTTALWSLQHEM